MAFAKSLFELLSGYTRFPKILFFSFWMNQIFFGANLIYGYVHDLFLF